MNRKFDINIKELNSMDIFRNYCFKDITIYNASTLKSPLNNTIIFCAKWDSKYIHIFNDLKDCLILIPNAIENAKEIFYENNQVIKTDNPRLLFAQIMKFILNRCSYKREYLHKENGIVVGENTIIGEGTIIEPFVFIDHDVEIGEDCIIKTGAKIRSNVCIGNNTIIGENAVIGGQGFGVEKDSDGRTLRIPHIGGVRIGSNVEIGGLNTINSGTIDPTVISDFCILDDQIHIGHNTYLGKSVLIAASSETSGGVTVGDGTYIGPGSVLTNKISLGKNCFVGIGTTVTKSFEDNQTIAGNPSKTIEELRRIKKLNQKLLQNMGGFNN